MKIPDPENYFDKPLRIVCMNGTVVTGWLDGFDYDYDDEGKEYLELGIKTTEGFYIGLTEDEIESIEIITK